MHSSKSQILVALKRQGRCSVDELAIALHLAPMTVRQHLATLERDGLVVSAEERQRMGRPHFVFSLTEQGDESFHMRYDRIALQLLHEVGRLDSQEIAGLSAEEKTALLFDRLADRFISRYRPRMGPLTLAQRIAAVTDALHTESGFTEWVATPEGYEIRDYNCFFDRLNGTTANHCRWHERILTELLETPIECRSDAPPSVQLCHFVIKSPDTRAGARPMAAALSMAGAQREPFATV